MAGLNIRSEFPPERCEICHQADCFDPVTNHCSRCVEAQVTEWNGPDLGKKKRGSSFLPIFTGIIGMFGGATIGIIIGDKIFPELADDVARQARTQGSCPDGAFFTLILGEFFSTVCGAIIGIVAGIFIGKMIEAVRSGIGGPLSGWRRLISQSRYRNIALICILALASLLVLVQFIQIFGGIALRLAAKEGNSSVVRALVTLGVAVDGRGLHGNTALIQAASSYRADTVRVLLEAGADPNAKDTGGFTPLMGATAFARDTTLIRYLIASGADPNAQTCGGITALTLASSLSTPDVVRTLIAAGVDVNARDGNTMTPLMLAVTSGKTESAEALIEAGADVNACDIRGRTALIHTLLINCSDQYRTRIVQALIKAGTNVSIADGEKKTALSYAQERGFIKIEQLLTEANSFQGDK